MKNIRISARFSEAEKQMLTIVAAQLHRTQSDTLRVLIYEKAEELELSVPWGNQSRPLCKTRETDGSDRGNLSERHAVGN